MATMQCPECGREYALSATRCTVDDAELVETLAGDEAGSGEAGDEVDDDVAAVDETDGADDDGDDEPADDRRTRAGRLRDERVVGQDRVLLEQLLAGADVARAWEGTDLVVRAATRRWSTSWSSRCGRPTSPCSIPRPTSWCSRSTTGAPSSWSRSPTG